MRFHSDPFLIDRERKRVHGPSHCQGPAHDERHTLRVCRIEFLDPYFFKSFLLGVELVWQVLHALPWAIAGVASAFGPTNRTTEDISKIAVAVPITIANLSAFAFCCMGHAPMSAREFLTSLSLNRIQMGRTYPLV
jgi:hypothetical protein